jgi:anti-sigma regulatory factor (Ser/Thr protein kinase)
MRLRLFPTLEAPSEARRGLASLAPRLDGECFDGLKTVVSELVTISVAHGATRPLDVSVTLAEGAVEGILHDEGPGTRAIVRARDRQDNSLVLRVIEGLVDEWGTNQGQTRIWFRISC